jgi:hypothetical protein
MLRVAFALSFGLLLTRPAQAQTMGEAAGQLASRISSLLPRRAIVSLESRNLTALAPAEWSSFRSQLEDALQKAGVEMAGTATTPPESRVRVTLSENARGLLFIAEVSSGESHQIAMLPWTAPGTTQKPRFTLSNQPIWEQPEPVLDILLLDSKMLVLNTSKLASYQQTSGKWTLSETAPLTLVRPVPRDPRGRIQIEGDGFRAFLPGTTCSGTLQPALKVTCMAGSETWAGDPPLRWVTDRNLLESGQVRGAFYSPTVPPASGAEAWGSDVAAIDNPCSSGATAIASGAGVDPGRDQIQVYEIDAGQASATSEPLTLPGPVTALWPAESRGQATLVVRNSQTGNYEASRLGVACAQ